MYRQQHTQSEMTTEMRKNEYKALTLQQKDHIASLMERLDSEKRFAEKLCGEKYDVRKELEALKEATCDYEYLKESHLTEKQLEDIQSEEKRKATEKALEWCSEQMDALRKEVRDLTQEKEELADYYDKTYPIVDALHAELAEIKEGKFDCDVYWSAINGEITLYKIPNEVGSLNTPENKNAVLEAFQSNCFGEEWGTYSKLEIVEMTREMLEEELGEELCDRSGWDTQSESEEEEESEDEEDDMPPCEFCGEKVTERDCPCLENVTDEAYEAHLEKMKVEEPETPKSHKDIAIDQLNEEQVAPIVYLEAAPCPELVEGGERRFTITSEISTAKTPEFEAIPEGTFQIVKGYFSTEFVWRVPKGVNLHDTETYEFGDKWGVLYIENKKTKEEWRIEEHEDGCCDDFKRAHDLEVLEEDCYEGMDD